MKNKVVVFCKVGLNDENSPLDIFETSAVTYYNYEFNEVEISSKLNDFWDRMGDTIKSIKLQNCDVCEKVFVYMLEKCANIEGLAVQSCKELFMSGRLLEGKTEGLLSNSLENLKILSLSGNQFLTDALFDRFVSAAPSLEELNLSGCSLQFHLGLIKKFYPPTIDIFQNPSESVLTFYFIWQFIKARAKNIKRLLFSKTLIDGSALKLLSETENLQLQSLEVHLCDQLTNTGFLALTTHQTTLRELDVSLCTRVTDVTLVHISKNLVNLEYLNIQRCRAVTDLGVAELHKLKKLKSLNISECELITKEGLKIGIFAEQNEILEELDVHSLNLDQSAIIMLSETLPKLRSLNLSYCFNAVTDVSIQVIFKNQVLLHSLKLSHCDKVSDVGLTGMGKVEAEGDDERPIMSDYDEPDVAHPKIYLGSRAEEEIVRDARRKRDVLLMCEKLSLESFTGYSLARVKGLHELDVSNCNKITDVSLMYAFNLKEMERLNMSGCQQITHEGIEYLVKNCCSIKYFNLTDCYNLKDEAVKEIVRGLPRLQHLELRVSISTSSLILNSLYC